jgi:hypothetical protein
MIDPTNAYRRDTDFTVPSNSLKRAIPEFPTAPGSDPNISITVADISYDYNTTKG